MPWASQSPGMAMCTKEAKICPDGSTVGRGGPNCEFDPCPVPTAATACGFVDGRRVDCPAGQICGEYAGFSSLPTTRCLPENFCENSPCAVNEDCVMSESWPVQISCVPKNGAAPAPQVSGNDGSGAVESPALPDETSGKKYVGHSAEECSRIKFMCIQGTTYFQDAQGCGCIEEGTDPSAAD